ncbi:uncharacterized protein LOC118644795 [Monomorium pharaonis]|uniref:uncharacterized protein LOC118644795 n=1 Tax=Monomorium pharaonis TaxID=307658 RepID=UPI001745E512|nr:uncharacterized protein LOC118644795 [Monomorium pharaonis]
MKQLLYIGIESYDEYGTCELRVTGYEELRFIGRRPFSTNETPQNEVNDGTLIESETACGMLTYIAFIAASRIAPFLKCVSLKHELKRPRELASASSPQGLPYSAYGGSWGESTKSSETMRDASSFSR